MHCRIIPVLFCIRHAMHHSLIMTDSLMMPDPSCRPHCHAKSSSHETCAVLYRCDLGDRVSHPVPGVAAAGPNVARPAAPLGAPSQLHVAEEASCELARR